MKSDLEIRQQVKAVFDDITAATPAVGPTPRATSEIDNPSRSRVWLAVAATGIVIAGTAAIAVTRSNSNEPTPALAPTAPPVNEPTAATVVPNSSTSVTTPSTAPATAATGLVLGGPIVDEAADVLTAAGFTVVTHPHRTFQQGVATLTELADSGNLPETVVLSLSDNDIVSENELHLVMQRALREVDRVVFVTTAGTESFAESSNELIRALPDTYANALVVDWATLISDCPGDCLTDTGHLTPDGVSYLADLVVAAVQWQTPYEATGYRTGDALEESGEPLPTWFDDDGQLILARQPEWTPVSRDNTIVGFIRKVDQHRFPPPPTALPADREPLTIYDDDAQPVGHFGEDGWPVLDAD